MKILDIIALCSREPRVGSKVRIKEYAIGIWPKGKVGTISEIIVSKPKRNYPYRVEFGSNYMEEVFSADEFEVVF